MKSTITRCPTNSNATLSGSTVPGSSGGGDVTGGASSDQGNIFLYLNTIWQCNCPAGHQVCTMPEHIARVPCVPKMDPGPRRNISINELLIQGHKRGEIYKKKI